MRFCLAVLLVAACGHKSATPDAPVVVDAAPMIDATPDARIVDTTFTCTSQNTGGDSCDGPLFDTSIQPTWTLQVMGDTITITAQGFDTATIGCTGAWDADLFDCLAEWRRAGRLCDLHLHVRQEANGTLTVWVGTVTSQTATCTS